MSYYSYFNLIKEPFSTTPDPLFFYLSKTHKKALYRLEISIRLQRGLNVILGDVGSGKTTLARTLINNFAPHEPFEFFLITDPGTTSEFQFLSSLKKIFKLPPDTRSLLNYKNSIKDFLYRKNIEEGITPILIIDEGQKLSSKFLEILRIFLNYETNNYKLLQLIICAQLELLPKINKLKNFSDRIVYKTILEPLDIKDTERLILFRLQQAGAKQSKNIFTSNAIKTIHAISGGLPRKITFYCSECFMHAIMEERSLIDEELVKSVITQEKQWEKYNAREKVVYSKDRIRYNV
ncbi:ExeA family protein [Chlamydiota bacterium]